MTRHFPLWLKLGLCCLTAPGRDGMLRGTLHVPCPPAETVAKRTVATKKSHGGPRLDRVLRGAVGDMAAGLDVVLGRTA